MVTGRGTSSRDGAAVAGALLEELDQRGVTGIFATHLHELLELPLDLSSDVVYRRMGVRWVPAPVEAEVAAPDTDAEAEAPVAALTSVPDWTYELEDGVCTDSLALHTGRRFGMSRKMLSRAAELASHFDVLCRPTRSSTQPNAEADVLADRAREDSEALGSSQSTPTSLGGLDAVEQLLRQRGWLDSPGGDSSAHENAALEDGTAGLQGSSTVRLPAHWEPSPALATSACVYVLELRHGGHHQGHYQGQSETVRYYVGETEALDQRLRQHRAKGGAWTEAAALVLPVRDRSTARALETALQRNLEAMGLALESSADARHRRFSAVSPSRNPNANAGL